MLILDGVPVEMPGRAYNNGLFFRFAEHRSEDGPAILISLSRAGKFDGAALIFHEPRTVDFHLETGGVITSRLAGAQQEAGGQWHPVFPYEYDADDLQGICFAFNLASYWSLTGCAVNAFVTFDAHLPSSEPALVRRRYRYSREAHHPWSEIHPLGSIEAGSVLSWEHPFQNVHSFCFEAQSTALVPLSAYPGEVLSTGDFALPLERPASESEWQDWPMLTFLRGKGGISGGQWPALIRACHGQFREEVIPLSDATIVKARMAALRSGTTEPATRTSEQTGCFSGFHGNWLEFRKRGRTRLLWTLRGPHGPVYLVDSPDVSACYIFFNERAPLARQQAVAWADGTIGYQEARTLAFACIVHSGEWEARIVQALERLGVTP